MNRKPQRYLPVFLFTLLTGIGTPLPLLAGESKPLLDRNRLSLGIGIADNSVRRADETGSQIFVAYDLNQVNVMEGVKSSVEFGLMDYGFSRDSTGIWGTFVIEGGIGEHIDWLARAGYDIGDDSGLMFGAGVGFALSGKKKLRIEYVVRDDIDSLQFNFLFHL